MRYMKSDEIRKLWIEFFTHKGHLAVESAPLIPKNDKSILWINAGVAPLKKYFEGSEIPPAKRLVNVQKSIRTNDIDNVGNTARHHTFFEMMGNFSIGDYFKEEAIEYGYELLFSNQYFGFDKNDIYITYYPRDFDCYNKWLSLGVLKDHLIPLENNFWEIGEGPCGPDTEIFFDRGPKYDQRGVELIKEDIENDRFIEIWNIVFSQYNSKNGLKRSDYPELPSKNIDTGAGLERFACVLQGANTNYETDLFLPIIKQISELSSVSYSGQMEFKVIADHIKALVFAIADGAVLSNFGRGYVLRRILRRAVKYGHKLGFKESFLYKLVAVTVNMMKDFYPYLGDLTSQIELVIKGEEEKFFLTINEGEKLLKSLIANHKPISKEDAFKLYDTFGFPIELTVEYAEESNLAVDVEGFYKEMQKQKDRSKSARTKISSMKSQKKDYLEFKMASEFVGYNELSVLTDVIHVFDGGIVLSKTPFYATSGGQVADIGTINNANVLDVVKLPNGQHLHKVDQKFNIGDKVLAVVSAEKRKQIERNHSATHLLQQALKDVLGKHISQQGSYVADSYLRFDFNSYSDIESAQLLEIEEIVKTKIKEGLKVNIYSKTLEEAQKMGAIALFGEKYKDRVRVIDMGYSIELCGGTHVLQTNEIIDFAIVSLASIGSGIYRIEAYTGSDIKDKILKLQKEHLKEISEIKAKYNLQELDDFVNNIPKINGSYSDLIHFKEYYQTFNELVKEIKKNEKKQNMIQALKNIDSYILEESKVVVVRIDDLKVDILKQMLDLIFDKKKASTVFIISKCDEKVSFLAKSNNKKAKEVINLAAALSNGSGGGKDDLAQGGTKDILKIDLIIKKVKEYLK